MSDQVLEQQINIKFCVKLGKNARGICAMFSEAYGGDDMKKSSVFEWHKWFKDSLHVNITNEDNAHYCLQYQRYCSL
jgi:hypothetical protein